MRFYYLAGFLFTFNMILSLIAAFGVFGAVQGDKAWLGIVQEESKSTNYIAELFPFGDWISALGKFIAVMGYCVIGSTALLPVTLSKIGIHSPWLEIFTGVSWFSYFGGFLTFLGRNPE